MLLSLIDSGKFFTRPMRWLYVFFAILSFIPTLFVLYYMYDEANRILMYLDGWAKYSGYLFCILFALFIIVSGLLMFYYWMNRSRKVVKIVNEGDQIVAMPIWAHLVQSLLESCGVYICLVPPMAGSLCPCMLPLELYHYPACTLCRREHPRSCSDCQRCARPWRHPSCCNYPA